MLTCTMTNHFKMNIVQNVITYAYLVFLLFGFYGPSEPSQTLGGVKTRNPREKQPDYPQAEFGLTRARLKPTEVRWRVI